MITQLRSTAANGPERGGWTGPWRFGDAVAVWLWIVVTVVLTAVVTWRVADWSHRPPAPEPRDETLRLQLVERVNDLSGDQCRWVCGLLARSARAEQEVLWRALDEVMGPNDQGALASE